MPQEKETRSYFPVLIFQEARASLSGRSRFGKVSDQNHLGCILAGCFKRPAVHTVDFNHSAAFWFNAQQESHCLLPPEMKLPTLKCASSTDRRAARSRLAANS